MGRLARRLALFAPLGLALAGVNYLVDPGHLFGQGLPETRLAEELSAGRSVVAGFAIDELRLQQSLAERRVRAPDVLVLGSSRALPLSAEAFPGQEIVVNASVSSASLEDAIALLELYEEHGLRPRALLLGVEPWALNGSLRNTSVALEAQLRVGLRRLGQRVGPAYGALPGAAGLRRRWARLVSPAYFQASLVSVLTRGFEAGAPRATGRGRGAGGPPRAASSRMHPDGSVDWEPALADRRPLEVEAMARAAGARAPGYLQARPRRDRVQLLEALLQDLRGRGVRVILWLPPFHPAAYADLVGATRGQGLVRGEAEVRALAAAAGIPVLGSYDPSPDGVSGTDFIDYNHLRRAAANRLLVRLLAGAGIHLTAPP